MNYHNRRCNSQPLVISVIALATCLILCLVGFALMYSSARESANELIEKNKQLQDQLNGQSGSTGGDTVESLKKEIDRLNGLIEQSEKDNDELRKQIDELNRKLEEALKNTGLANKKLVALTFDDGPGKYTAQLLDFLKEHNVRATFFVVGYNAKKYEGLLTRMAAEGHEVGNHSDKHENLSKLSSKDDVIAALDECNALIKEATGKEPVVMRPPGGSVNETLKSAAKEMGLSIIYWQVDTRDWQSRDKDKILQVAFDSTSPYSIRDGSIVLMHDVYQTTYQAVTEMVVRLENEGYTFVTVPQLLSARGGMVAGEVYKKAFPV